MKTKSLKKKSKSSFTKNNCKIHTKTLKKCQIITNFNHIYKDFCDWLVGIQEDDPLPVETTNIYFIVQFSQNDIAFSYSADDRNLTCFDYGSYFPLEAQYFFCDELKTLSQQLFIKKNISKQDVFDMLNLLILKAKKELDFLSSKHIFVGERFEKISYNLF